jgi:hypothetical protein
MPAVTNALNNRQVHHLAMTHRRQQQHVGQREYDPRHPAIAERPGLQVAMHRVLCGESFIGAHAAPRFLFCRIPGQAVCQFFTLEVVDVVAEFRNGAPDVARRHSGTQQLTA